VELWCRSYAFEWAIGGVGFSSCNGCRWRSSGKDRHRGFHGVNGLICGGFGWMGERRR